tara:strand:- start:660 stop:1469 length:810 start_codon:yes stop_codon:yes gene_type:complete
MMLDQLCATFGVYPPKFQKEKMWKISVIPQVRRNMDTLRAHLMKAPVLLSGLLDERMFVARPEWTEAQRYAFNLKAPPSPYEVACALLQAPTAQFWGLARAKGFNRCRYSMLLWWVAGLPEEAMIHHLGISSDELDWNLAKCIEDLMETDNFSFWALNPLMDVVCTTQSMRVILRRMREGRKTGTGAGLGEREAKDRLFAHPYYRAQLYSGKSDNPQPRPNFTPGIIWETLDERRKWERTWDGKGLEWLMIRRRMVRTLAPQWAQLPIY